MARLHLGGVSIIATLTATLAGPIDFLLDTNAVAFIGMFTVLAGLALPMIAIRAGSHRKKDQLQQQRQLSANTESYRKRRFVPAQTARIESAASSFGGLGVDEHGINRAAKNAGTGEIFHVGAAHRFTSDDTA